MLFYCIAVQKCLIKTIGLICFTLSLDFSFILIFTLVSAFGYFSSALSAKFVVTLCVCFDNLVFCYTPEH